ncbi:MAG: YaiI/YqxD family protein [Oscillospiraceae bacterium]
MEIFVDADACPVKKIIVELAKKYGISVTMLIDTSHVLDDGYSKIITVEQGRDSVDFKLIGLIKKGDVVVSQDYGVAAMALGKQAFALNQNGLIYTDENIERLLFERHIGQEQRRNGRHCESIPKRKKADDDAFRTAFEGIISPQN